MRRREFLKGGVALSFAGISDFALAGDSPLTAPASLPNARTPFVLVFLRGGADTLSLLSPLDDSDFIAARPPEYRFTLSGFNEKPLMVDGTSLYWHPKAEPLAKLYVSGRLAPWVAVGFSDETRSHFEAQEIMDRGVGSLQKLPDNNGWMVRQLARMHQPLGKSVLPLFAGNNNLPGVMQGSNRVMAARDLTNGINYPGGPAALRALQSLCSLEQSHPASALMKETADTINAVNQSFPKDPSNPNKVMSYVSGGSTPYPNSDPGVGLKSVARLLQSNVGLQYACVDHLGWDTHEYQNGKIDNLVRDLSNALGAFDEDMQAQQQRYTLVVMTEFGRRLRTNRSGGTDHGHASTALIMGSGVVGGETYGRWPGLSAAQLDRGVDLAVTTDYREVLKQAIRAKIY
ncbi:DUF1501 domain-containing protein [Polynucleobacter sp. Latsch14-2]|jgi:uncharacterized protein (DUF1501 family)|uniref:DUF1501 domain-containing protein n=1 Tax=Polynucleobacter sp. Latsch14-2 TaxID=2576920 RepID=UPI001C0D54CE|nr:DUF1501 domain-containing protein [Polynucleobacter sp. Latsch14-2]MBU3614809.1 DUF1501 domain-containing protein [Polynucleobacter sp. Latsch14-2]